MRTFALIAVLMGARAASGQPAGAQAEMLFRQGKDLLAEGKTAEACAAFDASQKLDPTTATLLNQASCRERNGEIATAWGLFLEAERKTRTGTDELTVQMHKTAEDHATRLESRLSTLTIVVPETSRVGGLEILRDHDTLDPVMWSKALPLDGGTYRITARAPGNSEWSTTVTVANERDAKAIEIPKLRAAELSKPAPPPAQPEAPAMQEAGDGRDHDEQTEPARVSHPTRWVPYAVGGGALVLLGGGIALELASESTYDSAKSALDPAEQTAHWHTANNERYAAVGLGVAGVGALGAAAWLYFHERGGSQTGVAITPTGGTGLVGFQITGGF